MKTYATKATAKRAAINEIAKTRGLDKTEIKENADQYFVIEGGVDNGFYPHFLGTSQVSEEGLTAAKIEETHRQVQFNHWIVHQREEASRKAMEENAKRDSKKELHDLLNPKKEDNHKSTVERPTRLVWDIAEEMKAANPEVRRKDVIEECVRRGVAFYTARTQYQQWLTVNRGEVK